MANALGLQAAAMAALVGFLGLALSISWRRLLLPWGALLDSLLVFDVLIYWAWGAYGTKAYPRWFAFAVFAGMQGFLLAFGFSVQWVGLLSWDEMLDNHLPSILIVTTALSAFALYKMARRRFDAPKPSAEP